jgi:hypothetical protein
LPLTLVLLVLLVLIVKALTRVPKTKVVRVHCLALEGCRVLESMVA